VDALARPTPEALERLARDCDVVPFKSSGPGGQKKNKTESSVRVRHRPTGVTRIATESRSQLRNRVTALERVWLELKRRAKKPKPRVKTKPGKGAVEKRLAEKKQRSLIKRARTSTEE
jgi:protein subunit release factor A